MSTIRGTKLYDSENWLSRLNIGTEIAQYSNN